MKGPSKSELISIVIVSPNSLPVVVHGIIGYPEWRSGALHVMVKNQFRHFYDVFLSDFGAVETRWKNSQRYGPVERSNYSWSYYAARQAATIIFYCFCARFRCKDVAKLICLELGKHKRNHIWQNIK